MIFLGHVKFRERENLGDDRFVEVSRGNFLGFFGGVFLRFVVIKDHGAILCAFIGALAVHGGRIVRFQKISSN